MPPRKRRVDLSPEAQEDYEAILLHSLTTWGEQQAAAYKAVLDRALDDLGTYPEMGSKRDDLAPGLRGFPVKPYIILYRIERASVRVLRILHGRRDIAAALGE